MGSRQEQVGSRTSTGVHAALLDLIAARIPPERAPIPAAFARAYTGRDSVPPLSLAARHLRAVAES